MLKRKTISVIAMILAMTMLVGIVPFGAFAAEDRAAGAVEAEENVLHNAVQSSAPEDVETAQESEAMPEDGDLDSNDAALDGEAVGSAPVLQPAVPFAANLEKQNPEKEPICEYEFAEGVIEIPLGTDVEIADENDGFAITIRNYKVEIPIGSTIAVYVNYIAYVFEAELVEYRNGSIIVHAHKRPDDAILSAKVAYSRKVDVSELEINPEYLKTLTVNEKDADVRTITIGESDGDVVLGLEYEDLSIEVTVHSLWLNTDIDWHWFWPTDSTYNITLNGNWDITITNSKEESVSYSEGAKVGLFTWSPSGTRIDKVEVYLALAGSISLESNVQFSLGCEGKGFDAHLINDFNFSIIHA